MSEVVCIVRGRILSTAAPVLKSNIIQKSTSADLPANVTALGSYRDPIRHRKPKSRSSKSWPAAEKEWQVR